MSATVRFYSFLSPLRFLSYFTLFLNTRVLTYTLPLLRQAILLLPLLPLLAFHVFENAQCVAIQNQLCILLCVHENMRVSVCVCVFGYV